ncbi:MAG: nucleotide disphospho-sugar-binding domain-containing protein, partial [Acetobacteraceae bacterium]
PQPSNIHIERFIPQSVLLPDCDLVVHQGGFSTVTGALNAGLPMVVIPIGADQPDNAACCAALGVGVVIEPHERTPEAIRAAVRAVMDDPSYRQAAEHMRDEMAALPGPEHAVELLERLVAERQPLLTA